MLTIFRIYLLRWLAARTLGGVIAGALGAALPLAIVLKLVGFPLLAAVGVVGAPLGIVLTVVRLPIRIVLGTVGLVSTLAAGAFALGLVAIKVVVVVLLASLAVQWVRRRPRGERPVFSARIV
ncbi:MAG: hypothetical protein M3154_05445 [Candidatus Eremiobacteraeota bacterium]|nr:hypothetical protein [Candidatus Eremiobacteraeota bacterium]